MSEFVELPDLACEDVGGAAIACNDEFFAAMENLLRARAAEWREHEYTDRGKWMDGWETRRRRDGGDRDWCIVRLGMPGKIRGVVVDTAYFRGNFPEACAVQACEIDDPLDLRALDHAAWTEILPRSALRGDAKNAFAIAIEHDRRFTHVRLEIFPDGGVARLRVHGEVAPRWELRGGLVDLAALDNGAVVTSCSDMFFGNRANLIKPGPSRSMADGWETRRRRGPGNDWAVIRLAARGTIERLELDTSHFKGNAPGRCTVACGDRVLLATPLQPHARHVFVDELRRIGDVDELTLSVFPDGGVARLRAWGTRAIERPHALDRIDRDHLLRVCGSRAWVELVAAQRPYEDVGALLRIAERAWWSLGADDHLEAFAAHPKIGEQSASAWSRVEQAGASSIEANARHQLGELNARYAERFGFIFITCASGRTIDDMLAELRARVDNARDVELRVAAEEQAKIIRLRLRKLIGELS